MTGVRAQSLDSPADDLGVEVLCAGSVRRHELVPDEASAFAVIGHPQSPMLCEASRRPASHPFARERRARSRLRLYPESGYALSASLLPGRARTNRFRRTSCAFAGGRSIDARLSSDVDADGTMVRPQHVGPDEGVGHAFRRGRRCEHIVDPPSDVTLARAAPLAP